MIQYISLWRTPSIGATTLEREQIINRQFYLRPHTLLQQLCTMAGFSGRSIWLMIMFFGFMLALSKKGDRNDLF